MCFFPPSLSLSLSLQSRRKVFMHVDGNKLQSVVVLTHNYKLRKVAPFLTSNLLAYHINNATPDAVSQGMLAIILLFPPTEHTLYAAWGTGFTCLPSFCFNSSRLLMNLELEPIFTGFRPTAVKCSFLVNSVESIVKS